MIFFQSWGIKKHCYSNVYVFKNYKVKDPLICLPPYNIKNIHFVKILFQKCYNKNGKSRLIIPLKTSYVSRIFVFFSSVLLQISTDSFKGRHSGLVV